MGDDHELEKRAVEELLKEASRGRVRAETMGPAGWMKCPLGSTNKRFLLNTLRPSAGEQQPGSQTRRHGEHQGHHRHSEDSSPRKDHEHKRERARSSSQSKHLSSASRGHSPHRSNQSNRARSRSPVRERSAGKKSNKRTRKR